jgi:hypothetical protein
MITEKAGRGAWLVYLAMFLMFGCPAILWAGVVGVEFTERHSLPTSSNYPAYEKIAGHIKFGIDPETAVNRVVVDIKLAPRNADGLVEARANFMILRPLEEKHDRQTAFLEVSNRGGKAGLRYFNHASQGVLDPTLAEHFGDGLLMRQGLTLVWVGWQYDVPQDDPNRLSLEVPVASGGDAPIQGLVRSDWVVDEQTDVLALGHRNHRVYPPASPEDEVHRLTRRWARDAPRELVPREDWQFVTRGLPDGQTDAPHIHMPDGFAKGHIYELVYLAQDPKVVGLGLAAIRDTMAWLKHEAPQDLRVEHGIAFGVSQTGRFLRQYLYQGFNEDEQGRRVFDGMLIHTAGAGRGSFNHRFAQPSRDGHRYSAFLYPTDLFPFSSRSTTDPSDGRSGGLLAGYASADLLPKIMVTNTGYEYWGRAAALIHIDPTGTSDVEPMANERIYHLASGQHFVGRWPPNPDRRLPGAHGWQGNPLDFLVNLRALAVRLADWVSNDRMPPASRYPTIRSGDLVPIASYRLPSVPGVKPPAAAHTAYRADYGNRWLEQGIVSNQPPILNGAFPTLVPAVDRYGNEKGGVRNLEIRLPLATFTPWSLRYGLPNPDEMADFRGLLVPLSACPGEGDDRPALSLPGKNDWMAEVRQETDILVAEGFLLDEDRQRVANRATELYQWHQALQQDCPADSRMIN